jgi:hypothetical protein
VKNVGFSHARRAAQLPAQPAILALAVVALLALILASCPARADQLADFNAAVEGASAHNRVALGYLRTGNNDLASIEIDRARTAWRGFVGGFAGKRPAAFKDVKRYTTVLTDVAARLVSADMMLNIGRPDIAAQSLMAIRVELADLRQSAGIEVLADCILRANGAMDALQKYSKGTLDLDKAPVRTGLSDSAKRYGSLLDHCDSLTGKDIHAQPEFRRLIDGAKASLALIPVAITEKDSSRVRRILSELRSFDNLLAFRFG